MRFGVEANGGGTKITHLSNSSSTCSAKDKDCSLIVRSHQHHKHSKLALQILQERAVIIGSC